jgi:hypothetical protein
MKLRLLAIFVLAPLLAAVLIATLLLLGAPPHLVFLPGHTLKAWLGGLGYHVPNAAGVLTTVAVWWAIILVIWLALRSLRPSSR